MHTERYRVPADDVGGVRGGRAGRRRRHDVGAGPRERGGDGPARRAHGPVPAPWRRRVPGRRRAADQLPPAAHDAADDDRRVRRAALARPVRDGARRRATASCRSATRCCSTAPPGRFRALHPVTMDRRRHRRRGPRRRRDHGPRDVPHAVLHARRHAWRGQVPERRRLRGARRRDRARQHVPPDAAPRRRGRRPLRRARRLHRLGRPHADRQRWLPGLLAAAEGRRRRRHVPQRLRRLDAPLHAGVGRRDPGAARRRHPDGPRRVPAAAEPARRRSSWRSSAPPPGPSGARAAHRRDDQALFGIVQGGVDESRAGRQRRAHRRPRLRRLRHRRVQRRGDAAPRCCRRSPPPSPTCRPTGRAT